jgi:hypothetical protein
VVKTVRVVGQVLLFFFFLVQRGNCSKRGLSRTFFKPDTEPSALSLSGRHSIARAMSPNPFI